MNKTDKIYVAGHRGMVGSALARALKARGFTRLITCTHAELNLISQTDVTAFFEAEKPDYVFLAAAKVGGMQANDTFSAEFLYQNLMIQNNAIHNAYVHGVRKLCFLGSSCIYPKLAPQPIKEEHLLSGLLEPTNEAYAIAKITGIKMCEMYRKQYGCDFISAMPCNLYGTGDNYHPENSHVFPAFIRKIYLAKCLDEGRADELERIRAREQQKYVCKAAADSLEGWLALSGITRSTTHSSRSTTLTLWGSGNPKREFMMADDVADSCLFLMQNYSGAMPVNVGSGTDQTLAELAALMAELIGFKGEIAWDHVHSDGTPQKLMDVSRLRDIGWEQKIPLADGIRRVYQDFLDHG
jgi:GDP-L-fucose synthase